LRVEEPQVTPNKQQEVELSDMNQTQTPKSMQTYNTNEFQNMGTPLYEQSSARSFQLQHYAEQEKYNQKLAAISQDAKTLVKKTNALAQAIKAGTADSLGNISLPRKLESMFEMPEEEITFRQRQNFAKYRPTIQSFLRSEFPKHAARIKLNDNQLGALSTAQPKNRSNVLAAIMATQGYRSIKQRPTPIGDSAPNETITSLNTLSDTQQYTVQPDVIDNYADNFEENVVDEQKENLQNAVSDAVQNAVEEEA
jgi:hypothetical protein